MNPPEEYREQPKLDIPSARRQQETLAQEVPKKQAIIPKYWQKVPKKKIIEAIRNTPKTTRVQLAEIIGITPDGIKKQLEKLKAAGRIKHVGPTKGGHWEIIE